MAIAFLSLKIFIKSPIFQCMRFGAKYICPLKYTFIYLLLEIHLQLLQIHQEFPLPCKAPEDYH